MLLHLLHPRRQPRSAVPPGRTNYMHQQELDAIVERLRAVAHQAAAGDDQAMDRLRAELDAVPWLPRMLGDLNRDIEEEHHPGRRCRRPPQGRVHPPTGLRAEGETVRSERGRPHQAGGRQGRLRLAAGPVRGMRPIKDPDTPRITKQLDHLQCSYTQALRALGLAVKLDVFQREAEQR